MKLVPDNKKIDFSNLFINFILGDIQTGDSHMKVVRVMNIIGPISGVILIIAIPVYVFTAAAATVYSYGGYYG